MTHSLESVLKQANMQEGGPESDKVWFKNILFSLNDQPTIEEHYNQQNIYT